MQNVNEIKLRMKKPIANIISKSKNIEFQYEFNRCKTMDEADTNLPTFIIGLDNAKKYIKDFNILKRSYPEQNLWWTFSKTERRTAYDDDLTSFQQDVFDKVTTNIGYNLIDVLKMKYSEIDEAIDSLDNGNEKIAFNHYNKFLFVYDKPEKTVYGISLSSLNYMGVDANNCMERVKNFRNTRYITDLSNIPFQIRKVNEDNIHKLLVLSDFF